MVKIFIFHFKNVTNIFILNFEPKVTVYFTLAINQPLYAVLNTQINNIDNLNM